MPYNTFCGSWGEQQFPDSQYFITLLILPPWKKLEWMQIPSQSALLQFYILFLLLGFPGITPLIISLDLPQIILPHGGQPGRASQ